MAKFKVWHKRNTMFNLEENVADTFNRGDYQAVAEVETENIDDVFQLTNTIEHSWWLNPGVLHLFDGLGCRSTSVGDLIEDASGKFHRVDTAGFTEVTRID